MAGPVIRSADNGDATQEMPTLEQPGSLLAEVRKRAAAQQQKHVFDVPVGGAFEDRLILRYHPPTIDQADRYVDLTDSAGQLAVGLEMLVDCCEAVLWLDDEGEETLLEEDGVPVRIDSRLWRMLGQQGDDVAPSQVIDLLFGNNMALLSEHMLQVTEEMTETAYDPGESSAPTG